MTSSALSTAMWCLCRAASPGDGGHGKVGKDTRPFAAGRWSKKSRSKKSRGRAKKDEGQEDDLEDEVDDEGNEGGRGFVYLPQEWSGCLVTRWICSAGPAQAAPRRPWTAQAQRPRPVRARAAGKGLL